MPCQHTRRVFVRLLAGIAFLAAASGSSAASPVQDFCFLQISDIHLDPQPVGAADPGPGARSAEAIQWVCGEAKKPQELAPMSITAPAPAFVVATGDLTEYGVIHKTWSNFERYFEPLGLPLYVCPGNHDNTWTAVLHVMRKRHGGDHHSFDRFGCHFAFIDTATPQEPVPSIEARTLTWLRTDLAKIKPDVPVFLFGHHPLSTAEFAKPHEQLRLLETIRGHNVVLLLMGHGHGVRHERWNTLDSVMGGSTFGPNTGYSIISVIGGKLRVVYRYRDAAKPMQVVLEKSIERPQVPALEVSLYDGRRLVAASDTPPKKAKPVASGNLRVKVVVQGGTASKVTASLNGDDKAAVALERGEGGQFTGALKLDDLTPGRHFVEVTAETGALKLDQALTFTYEPRDTPATATGWLVDAGIKAGPLLDRGGILASTTAGDVHRLSDASDPARPLLSTGAEILHAPALVADTLYVSSGDTAVHAVTLDGKKQWRCETGACVYGTPAVDGEAVYVGDLEGDVHAIDRKTGKPRWSKHHAQFSIEQPLLLHDGVLYFGAWDGFVYAVNAGDGALKWKQPGPAGQTGESPFTSRYYAPADCAPIVVKDRLFVVDRAYRLGSYSLDGKYLGELAKEIAAVSASSDGRTFYARGIADGLIRFDSEGKRLWAGGKGLGRFPIPPTEADGKVYACSNRGLLTVHDAATGNVLAQYQVTPQLHVMASVAVDPAGNAYVAGMDGSVTRVSFNTGSR